MSFLSGIFGGSKTITPEQQSFEQEKNKLNEALHDTILQWLLYSHEDFQTGSKVDLKRFVEVKVTNTQTKKIDHLFLNKEVILSHNANSDQILKTPLNSKELAVFKFLCETEIKTLNNKDLKGFADCIKNVENIKDLKDSKLLKVAAMRILDENLTDDFLKSWK